MKEINRVHYALIYSRSVGKKMLNNANNGVDNCRMHFENDPFSRKLVQIIMREFACIPHIKSDSAQFKGNM